MPQTRSRRQATVLHDFVRTVYPVLSGIVVLVLCVSARAEDADARFTRLMRDLLIVDTHMDTPWYIVDEGYKLGEEHHYYEADIPRLRRGHVGAVFFGVVAEPGVFPADQWVPRALQVIDGVYQQVEANAKNAEIAYTASDIVRIHKSGKIAILLSLEGGHLIEDSLPLLRDFYRLGIRYMTLAHFNTNDWADSSADQPAHNGLTEFGRQVVREMNRLGMMIDVSHVSDRTFYDALATSRAPVMASHSCLRAICDIPRNLGDDMLRALARNGGVVCINFNVAYLDRGAYDSFMQFRDQREREVADMMARNATSTDRWAQKRIILKRYSNRLPRIDLKAVLRQIDHVALLVGADHVGLGSDFDGISGMSPAGLKDASEYPALVRGLIAAGYSDVDIRKIMGENLLRVMRANEKLAAGLNQR